MTQRKVKFRIFHKKAKKMIYLDDMQICGEYAHLTFGSSGFVYGVDAYGEEKDIAAINGLDHYINDGEINSFVYNTNIEEFEVMQYSGLKDKYSKEIYEGDIIKHTGFDDEEYIQECPSLNFFHFWEETEDNITVEVIGNIYENPELLRS